MYCVERKTYFVYRKILILIFSATRNCDIVIIIKNTELFSIQLFLMVKSNILSSLFFMTKSFRILEFLKFLDPKFYRNSGWCNVVGKVNLYKPQSFIKIVFCKFGYFSFNSSWGIITPNNLGGIVDWHLHTKMYQNRKTAVIYSSVHIHTARYHVKLSFWVQRAPKLIFPLTNTTPTFSRILSPYAI